MRCLVVGRAGGIRETSRSERRRTQEMAKRMAGAHNTHKNCGRRLPKVD